MFMIPIVAEEEVGLANILDVITTGTGELDGPIKYTLSGTLKPPAYTPGATKMHTGDERGTGNVADTVVT
jgi:hypothetical protein